ncbi:DUF488 domain-containing protein [Candidatus Aerophobetes bacterium]|nr:DUF488 domain-containing protein [Candidatus Aerophobetes bacterium]
MNTENKKIYSFGTSTREKEEFIELVKQYKIKAIIDVRRFPTSRFEHFKKDNLQRIAEKENIRYFYLGNELGGYRKAGYEEHTRSASFQAGMKKLEDIAIQLPSAFFCAEKLPWRCHRRFIADVLKKGGWRVIHIIEKE